MCTAACIDLHNGLGDILDTRGSKTRHLGLRAFSLRSLLNERPEHTAYTTWAPEQEEYVKKGENDL
ncbi:hypothetical protein M514_19191 [Trichuris suis]|uniref:Uncharacterized protein n=1 Tax=Trichuris suis TaxID=68888 RepID=A0A085NGG2_9BILA|nr:hypothetical protein M514_19191 [Trichuris suis]